MGQSHVKSYSSVLAFPHWKYSSIGTSLPLPPTGHSCPQNVGMKAERTRAILFLTNFSRAKMRTLHVPHPNLSYHNLLAAPGPWGTLHGFMGCKKRVPEKQQSPPFSAECPSLLCRCQGYDLAQWSFFNYVLIS